MAATSDDGALVDEALTLLVDLAYDELHDDDDCPQDDTCKCSDASVVNRGGSALARMRHRIGDLRECHVLTQSEWEAMTAEVHALKADNAALLKDRLEVCPTCHGRGVYPAESPNGTEMHDVPCPSCEYVRTTAHPGASVLSEMADLRRQLAEAKRENAENADALAQAQAELQAARKDADGYGEGWDECQKERDASQQRVRELEAKHAAAVGRARARYDVLDSLVRRTDPYDDGPCWCEHKRAHPEALHNRACRDARESMAWTGVDAEVAK